MKNHKGVVATLLTLGLVLVGTLITLGSSLFVSNQRTNLASNSRAAGTNNCCKREVCKNCGTGQSQLRWYGKYSSTCSANKLEDCSITSGSTCVNDSSCTAPAAPAVPAVPAAGAPAAGCTEVTCPDGTLNWKKGGSFYPTNQCAGTSPGYCIGHTQAVAAPATVDQCKALNAANTCQAKANCQTVESNVMATDYCKTTGKEVCCKTIVTAAVPPTIPGTTATTANQITTSTAVGTGQSCCFQKKGKVYVYSSYQSMVNNDMLDDAGNPDCGRQTGAVVNSYQADNPPGAFVCSGGTSNMTSIDTYNAANPAGGSPAGTNGNLVVPEGCISTNCSAKFANEPNFSTTVLISTNKTGAAAFYKSGDCTVATQVSTLNDLHQYCKGESTAQASITCVPDQKCSDKYTGANKNKYAYSIDGSDTTYYKGSSCYGTTVASSDADLKTYCTEDPAAAAAAAANAVCKPDISCTATGSTNNTKSKTSTKTYSGKTVYYESNDCSTGEVTKETAKAYCDGQPTITNDPHENVAFANPNLSFCDKGGAKLYIEPDLPAFALSCQTKYPNSCYQIIISDIGWFTARDYMYCCYKSC